MPSPIGPVLRNAAYRRLLTAQVVSLLGTGLATVALGLLAHDLAGRRAGAVLGTVFGIKMVAYVVLAPVATALVARLPRRSVMVTADVLRAVVALTLPFAGQVWQIYVLVFVLQAASAVHTPTFQSALPDVVTGEHEYTQALSFSRLADDLEMVLSPMLAAALLLVVSTHTLFVGTGLGFAASAVLIVSVVIPRAATPAAADEGTPFEELPLGARVRHGALLMAHTPGLRPALALNLAVAAAGAFVLVQTVVIARDTFGQSNDVVALLLAVNGLGSMTTALALPAVLRRRSERAVMLGGAVLLTVATFAVPLALGIQARTAGLVAVGALWLAVGAGWAAAEVPIARLIVRHVPAGERRSVFAAQFSLSHACWLVTYPLAGWLGAAGLRGAALVLAVVAAAATVGATALWPRSAAVPTA
ncbi:MFS transporter [Cellulomonas sp. SG140]|uniref:MFS transporter n=1 Tax=Cellulomonas sp. SG140 TaxID=2976536 RepID=UPI0021E9AAD9|nr:MFS transporter [Cellulomonas sp. SG140]